MPPRPIFPPTADAPIRLRLVVGWGLFFVFVLVGLVLLVRHAGSVTALLDLVRA